MYETKTYGIKGMHCASCAAIIEKTLRKTDGVVSAEVNYGTEAVKVTFDADTVGEESLAYSIQPLGYSLVIPVKGTDQDTRRSKEEKLSELLAMRKD